MQKATSLLLLILLCCATGAHASQIKRITLAELQARADFIVMAKVTTVAKDGNRDHVTIKAGSYLKGKGTQKSYTFTLVTRGGLKDFDPALKAGDTGVFFLKRKEIIKKGYYWGVPVEKAYWGSVAIFQQNHFVLTAEKKGRPADGARKRPAKTSKAHASKPKPVQRPSDLDVYAGMNRFILPRPAAILPATARVITPLVRDLSAEERHTQAKKFDDVSYQADPTTLATYLKSTERAIERSKELHPVYRAALMFNVMKSAQEVDTWKAGKLRAKLECRAATAALERADEVPLGLVLRILEMSAHARLSFEDGTSPKWPTIRRNRAELWLSSLKRLQATIDPAWDPKDVPQGGNLVPPGGKYPSGIAPANIKEPAIRAAYEAMLAKNRRKGEWYSIQSTSRKLLRTLHPKMKLYLVRFYTLGPAREAELKSLLKKYSSVVPESASILWTTGTIRSILPRGERGKFGLLHAAFAKAGKPAVPKLTGLLTDKRTMPFAREEALHALGMIADARALPALKKFAGDPRNPLGLRKTAQWYVQAIESTDRGTRKTEPPSVKSSDSRAISKRVHHKTAPPRWSGVKTVEGIQVRLSIDDDVTGRHEGARPVLLLLEVRNKSGKRATISYRPSDLTLKLSDASGKPVPRRRPPDSTPAPGRRTAVVSPGDYVGFVPSRRAKTDIPSGMTMLDAGFDYRLLTPGRYFLHVKVTLTVGHGTARKGAAAKRVTVSLPSLTLVVPE